MNMKKSIEIAKINNREQLRLFAQVAGSVPEGLVRAEREKKMKVTCNEKENDIVFVPENDDDIFNLGKMLGERKIACLVKFTADTDNKKSQLNAVQISTQKIWELLQNPLWYRTM